MMTGVTRPLLPSVYVNALQNTNATHNRILIMSFKEIRFGSSMQLYPYHTYYVLHIIFDQFIIQKTYVYGETQH